MYNEKEQGVQMQKVQLADRLGNVQTKKVGFSWLHFFFGPIYCFFNLKFLFGLLELLLLFLLCPIPGMQFIADSILKLTFIPEIVLKVITNSLLLFRSTPYTMALGIICFFIFHLVSSFRIKPRILRRTLKRKELRPVEEKDARILIKWRVVKDDIGLAESFDIRGTTKYKSAEENWYENNQIRIKSRPSFSTRSNIRYTVEQKAQIQSEQLDNLYKLGLINKEEYHSKKNALKKTIEKDK